jgi:heme/copper-type cytochrome/quinol oxidase subunit 3
MKPKTQLRRSYAAIERTWTRLQTRRWLLWSCFASVAAIFAVNLAGLVILATRRDLIKGHPPSYIPDPPIFEGNCDYADTLGTVLHAVINALSTIMLAASNVCMQMLLSPTRAEIDRAHKARTWLHIGYSSLGNFRHVGNGRRLVWLLLALSSIPLHLLYV